MPITSLSDVKAHLRVDGTDEDTLITAYTDAAEGLAEHYCNRSFGSPLPATVTAAVYLMVGDLYENREKQQEGALSINATCENLLNTVKDWSRAASGALPAGVGFDPEPLNIGDDWSGSWTKKDATGTAVDVTGYTGTFELYLGDDLIHSGALTLTTPASGIVGYAIDHDTTATFDAGEYWYRVRTTSPADLVETLDRKLIFIR